VEDKAVKVIVKTPARLHLGLIDMNGDLGRMFGGLGIAIDRPNFVVEAENSSDFAAMGQEAELAKTLATRFCSNYHVEPKVHINVAEIISAHVGLGSGTQFSLAIATALSKVLNVRASVPELSIVMGRVRRTSVGTSAFMKGGFVVDGGKNLKTQSYPPLIYRQPIPADWRFIIAIPKQHKGLANTEETKAFNILPPMPTDDIAQICRLTMLKLLPALAEQDIESFGDALTRIQILTGKYFAQTQGGIYSSPAAAECIEFMKQTGAHGVGQSSWGPALYAVVKQEQAKQALDKIKRHLLDGAGGEVFIAKANNHGATIKTFED
jgi:beta-ribofuranosylaminobenzene 5'-phosphate synthase